MAFPFWLVLGILVLLLVWSVQMAYSGVLVGRTYIGWTLFVVYLLLYFPFAVAWYRDIRDVDATMIFHILFLILLILPLGALGAELLTLDFMPDPSRGLKLLRVHTEAEKKVAQDDLPGAIEEYEKMIANNSDDIAARLRMAELCIEIKQYERAAAAYEATLKKAPKLGTDQHCSILTQLSEIYARHLGEIEKARGFVRMIIDQYPDSSYADFAKDRLANL